MYTSKEYYKYLNTKLKQYKNQVVNALFESILKQDNFFDKPLFCSNFSVIFQADFNKISRTYYIHIKKDICRVLITFS